MDLTLFLIVWIITLIFCIVSSKSKKVEENQFYTAIDYQLEDIEPDIASMNSLELTLTDQYFNPSRIPNYHAVEEVKEFIFNPTTLTEYIGQEDAKKLVMLNIRKINEIKPVHFLISGLYGHGKTTLAHIIERELGATMIERTAGQITNPSQIEDLMIEINQHEKETKVILFIDEVHSLNASLCEDLHPIMERFSCAGRSIKPFTLIGATTRKDVLMRPDKIPFTSRFQAQIELTSYTVNDLITILKQYKSQLFPELWVDPANYKIIAERCKFTPRIALSLLDDNLVEQDIHKILEWHHIKKDGLTINDIKILEALNRSDRPIGEGGLSQILGINKNEYAMLYEGYLVSHGYINRTSSGRELSELGKQFLEEL